MNNPSIEGPPKRRNNYPPKPPKAMIRQEGGRFSPKNTALTHITLGGNNLLPEAQGQHATKDIFSKNTETHNTRSSPKAPDEEQRRAVRKNGRRHFSRRLAHSSPNSNNLQFQNSRETFFPYTQKSTSKGAQRKSPRRVRTERHLEGCKQEAPQRVRTERHLKGRTTKRSQYKSSRAPKTTQSLDPTKTSTPRH